MFAQFTELTAKVNFTMKLEKGRPIVVKAGDKFLVTSPRHRNVETVKIARKKTAILNQGYTLDIAQVMELFHVQVL